MKYFFFFPILLPLIIGTPQINLYYIDLINTNDPNIVLQHHCLRFVSINQRTPNDHQMISYCMSESLYKFKVESNDLFPKFTFAELSQQNVTSEQLYLWSTPIDIIERYQFYLNQLTTSNNLFLGEETFYNCTLPRFGSMCQYELPFYSHRRSSLYDIIYNFHIEYPYNPINLTCYVHLKCDRGPISICLDWSEICDGKIDCLNDESDEKHCWELEINECKPNEYRCTNGQCIPHSFYRDNTNVPDCIDTSDEQKDTRREICRKNEEASMACEDVKCIYTPLTKTCMQERIKILLEEMYSIENKSVRKICWLAFKCIVRASDSKYPDCLDFCEPDTCIDVVKTTCPDILYYPNVPVLFNDIYFTYLKNDSQYLANNRDIIPYICYTNSHYNSFFFNISKLYFNNKTCIDTEWMWSRENRPFVPVKNLISRYYDRIFALYELLKKYHLTFNYTSTLCNSSKLYQCIGSLKCISIYRLMDSVYDCPHMDDENRTIHNDNILLEQIQKYYFKCEISNKSIHPSFIDNEKCDCETNEPTWCEDERHFVSYNYIRRKIAFQTICDEYTELAPLSIDGRIETDETECEQWQCNNIYTRCDRIWNCPDGADERGCISYSTLNCTSNQYLCVSPITNQLICLLDEKINDGNIDCLGGTDERILCKGFSKFDDSHGFYCRNQSSKLCIHYLDLCNAKNDCIFGDDEKFCETNLTYLTTPSICTQYNYLIASTVEKLLCDYLITELKQSIKPFTLDGMSNLINTPVSKTIKNTKFSSLSLNDVFIEFEPICHRGLDLRVWSNKKDNSAVTTCLCPPSFYGDRCQYQNQRISLILKFQALSDSLQTLFAIIISLIDDTDDRIIHSYEQFSYLSLRDCKIKFSINLLYATRPKNTANHYAIHIDIYEKIQLIHRGSILLPVNFSFLPIQRFAFIVDIPRNDTKSQKCYNRQCVHGKCIKYSNNPANSTFCQCEQGWYGRYCHIEYNHTCASDSLHIGVSVNNRSICVCPIHKFGSRCLIKNTICQQITNLTCQNNGQCIPTDDHIISNQKFSCICPKGYGGDRCEIPDNKLILSSNDAIILSQSIFIHFIELTSYDLTMSTKRSTTFRTISILQNSVIIFWSQPFHLTFIELFNKTFYLVVRQNIYNQSKTIHKKISSSDRCLNISELFNETFLRWHLIRRIKYYHLPCQNQSLNLSCFHDDVHMCLCYNHGKERLTNCLSFDHHMTFNCFGQNSCQNDALCVQDNLDCPKRSICICLPCFYGSQCQFKTSGLGLSLDGIIGYHIIPKLDFTDQPFIIQLSLGLTIIFILIGFINSILSFITFKSKVICEVGCGLYLLGSSITTLLTFIMFGFKFLILLLTQMIIITNREFLLFQCHSFDFLLRICLCMDQWLNACVAVERAYTAIKATQFDKKKSKTTAKYVIIILIIIIIATSIHDPIYRSLIDEINDDDNVKRQWCITTYSSNLQTYNSIIYTFHFFTPFMMNLISVIILIVKQTKHQRIIHPQRSYRQHLREQFQQHKHLLTAPILLVILALPRLIITFISKCMTSINDSWLFLFGYFISFIPSMLTFVVFILPSKFYKKEFRRRLKRYRSTIQRSLHWVSEQ